MINRHKAIEKQHRGRGSLLVYMDGNTHRGYVGAAVMAGDRYRYLYMGLEL